MIGAELLVCHRSSMIVILLLHLIVLGGHHRYRHIRSVERRESRRVHTQNK